MRKTRQLIATGETIKHNQAGFVRIDATAGAATGVIMQKGAVDGQKITVVNVSANAATFAAVATSFVKDGANVSVAANRAIEMIWDAEGAAWYACESS